MIFILPILILCIHNSGTGQTSAAVYIIYDFTPI